MGGCAEQQRLRGGCRGGAVQETGGLTCNSFFGRREAGVGAGAGASLGTAFTDLGARAAASFSFCRCRCFRRCSSCCRRLSASGTCLLSLSTSDLRDWFSACGGRGLWPKGCAVRPVLCHPPPPPQRDPLEGKGPQRWPQRRLDRRLEEVAKAVRGGYCRLQMPLKPALGVRGTVVGHRLGALEGGRGAILHLSQKKQGATKCINCDGADRRSQGRRGPCGTRSSQGMTGWAVWHGTARGRWSGQRVHDTDLCSLCLRSVSGGGGIGLSPAGSAITPLCCVPHHTQHPRGSKGCCGEAGAGSGQATAYRYREGGGGGGMVLGLLPLTSQLHPHQKMFPLEKNDIYHRGPNSEVDFRYRNSAPPPPPEDRSQSPLSCGLIAVHKGWAGF